MAMLLNVVDNQEKWDPRNMTPARETLSFRFVIYNS
jgi:hypothetical protein